jgi:protein-S-isoprenylcysteine O-methyltransferase Ste14
MTRRPILFCLFAMMLGVSFFAFHRTGVLVVAVINRQRSYRELVEAYRAMGQPVVR